MEIIHERLECENDIDVVQTAPTVSYEVVTAGGVVKKTIRQPTRPT
jgi:GTP-binding protein LepA